MSLFVESQRDDKGQVKLRWTLLQYEWCSHKKGKVEHRHIQRGDHVNMQREDCHPQAGKSGHRRKQYC